MTAEKNPFAKFLTHFNKGHVLFHEGDDGEDMYIIQSGRVAIKKKVKDGDTTLAVLEKGDFFGEMAILERHAALGHGRGGRGRRPDRDRRRDLRGHDQGQPRDRRAHAAQALDPAARDEQAARAGDGRAARRRGRRRPPARRRAARRHRRARCRPRRSRYFISPATGNVFPVFKNDALIGRFDSVTGMRPEVDLTNEDQSRNISRRHARLVIKDGKFFVAEEIGTMNGTFLNGKKLPNGVLTPINDGDELTLCRLVLNLETTPR